MMGEYVLYYGGKIVGGVYDNRLLIKPTPSVKALMPSAEYQLPYEGVDWWSGSKVSLGINLL